jgi:hypothetical protein
MGIAWSFGIAFFGYASIFFNNRISAFTISTEYFLPFLSESRRCVCFKSGYTKLTFCQQIIKEKLSFPSGTATAQLISVLYKKPLRVDAPTISPPRRLSIVSEDRERLLEEEVDEPIMQNIQIMSDANGWTPLIWSFSVAALITVSHNLNNDALWLIFRTVTRLFLPRCICHSTIRSLSRKRIALVFHSESILRWTR